MVRDTSNAVALGMTVGSLLQDDASRPKAWQNIGWDQIVTDVDRAAEALDAYQLAASRLRADREFWEDHDWYLTLDAIAGKLMEDPHVRWDGALIAACLVSIGGAA